MSNYYCSICFKTIKHKSKKKHSNTESHKFVSDYVTIKYQVKDPNFDEIEDIQEKYINEHIKKFIWYGIVCKFKTISNSFSWPWITNITNLSSILAFLRTKGCFHKLRHKSSQILEIIL